MITSIAINHRTRRDHPNIDHARRPNAVGFVAWNETSSILQLASMLLTGLAIAYIAEPARSLPGLVSGH
jgi:hypothetical protein